MTVEVDISIAAPSWSQSPDSEEIVRRAVAASEAFFEPEDGVVELCVLLCDDAEIQALNLRWRGKDSATNVLSFPAAGRQAGHRHLGDIAIAYGTVAREAADEGKAFADHLAHLTIHGYLHLLGYDHETDEEAEEMEALEREILASLGIADPYSTIAATQTER